MRIPRAREVMTHAALLAALVAAAPAVQWCPIDWQRVSAAGMLRCALAFDPAWACENDPRRPACERFAGAPCPMAGATCGRAACDRGAAATHAANATSTRHLPRGRAYRLGDPTGATGLRSRAPAAQAPQSAPALVAVVVAVAPPIARPEIARREARSRAPTGAPAAPPPARAPPEGSRT